MTDHVARPEWAASSPRVDELRQLDRDAYQAAEARRREQNHRDDVLGLALPPAERCPAAHPDDPTPCGGPVVVTVLDRHNEGVAGCEHHGARLLASVDGARVYPLPTAPHGSAIRVFKAADTLQPYAWETPDGGEHQ
jgi:hypothetical protein